MDNIRDRMFNNGMSSMTATALALIQGDAEIFLTLVLHNNTDISALSGMPLYQNDTN